MAFFRVLKKRKVEKRLKQRRKVGITSVHLPYIKMKNFFLLSYTVKISLFSHCSKPVTKAWVETNVCFEVECLNSW
jgi:hypothetical protein